MKETHYGSCHWRNASGFTETFQLYGKDDLDDYQFATLQGHHRLCRNCGVAAFGDGDVKELGGAFVSISVAAIDDLSPEELERLPVRTMDGRHNNWMEPPQHGGYL